MEHSLSEMMCLDLYLSSLNEKEYRQVEAQIDKDRPKAKPLASWGVFSHNYHNALDRARVKQDIQTVKRWANREKWKNDLNDTFENNVFEALILTDLKQKILWVNKGFTAMTGYSKRFALHKKPSFLQGKATSEKIKKRIKKQLKTTKPFTEVITNYKKDKTSYKCEVKIIPLYNDKITHYLALEKQVI